MLFALQSDHSHVRPGIPYVFSSDVSVDAAEQVMTKTGQQIEMAELIIQLKGNPQSLTNDNEKGVRIIFKCVDLGDPNAVETSALWVLSLSNMLPVARLPHNKVLRVIAQPRVQDESLIQWQVIVSSDFDETDIDVWRRRKQWQGLKPRDEKAKRVSEIALATPKSKYIRTKEELQVSPGNIVQSHSVKWTQSKKVEATDARQMCAAMGHVWCYSLNYKPLVCCYEPRFGRRCTPNVRCYEPRLVQL